MKHKRVLIIEDDAEYAQLATLVLTASSDPFEVQTASALSAGLEILPRFKPDVILLDLDLPDSSGYDTFLRVRGRAEQTPIVVLTGLDDDRVALKAVEDGAQDYLVKGLQQPKLIARCVNMALRRQERLVSPKAPPHVIGFIGSKGGVGTSTLAMNVVALLAQTGCDTVAIEFESTPGALAAYLPADPAYGLNSLLEIPPDLLTHSDLYDGLVPAGPGLRILCSGALPKRAPAVSAERAQAILAAAQQIATHVVVDLPPRIDEGVAAALKLCDTIVLLVDREASAVRAAAPMLEQIKAAGCEENRVRLVAVDRTKLDTPVSLAEIFSQLKSHPILVVPHAAQDIALSHAARTPLVWVNPESRLSFAALELMQHLVPQVPVFPTAPSRLWNERAGAKQRDSSIYLG